MEEKGIKKIKNQSRRKHNKKKKKDWRENAQQRATNNRVEISLDV